MIDLKKEFFLYLKKISILSISVGLLALILFSTVLNAFYKPVFWVILAFFFLINFLGHSVILVNEKLRKMNFTNAYMLAFAIKFFGYVIFLIIYFFLHRNNVLFFGISLLLLYIIFTLFEVKASVSFSKRTLKNMKK